MGQASVHSDSPERGESQPAPGSFQRTVQAQPHKISSSDESGD